MATFYFHPEHPDGSSFINEPVDKEEIKVEKKLLDDVVRDCGINHIEFMKIDVEGVETEVLRGGKEAMKISDNVFVEISPHGKGSHSHDYIESFQLLHDAVFSLVGVYDDFFFSKIVH